MGAVPDEATACTQKPGVRFLPPAIVPVKLAVPTAVPEGSVATGSSKILVASLLAIVIVSGLLGGTSREPIASVSRFPPRLVEFRVNVPLAKPVPVSVTVCGLLGALSVIVRVAVRAEAALGVNVMLIPAVPPFLGAVIGRVVVTAKSDAFAPLRDAAVMVQSAVPLLVTVMAIGALAIPIGCWPNGSGFGLAKHCATGAMPVPDTPTL